MKPGEGEPTASRDQLEHEAKYFTWENQSTEVLVSAQILEMVERESIRRVVLHSGDGSGLLVWTILFPFLLYSLIRTDSGEIIVENLQLWIFNPDLRYSNSSTDDVHSHINTVSSQRGLKVFFQTVPNVEGLLNPQQGPAVSTSFTMEELELPLHTFEEISGVLKDSNGILPLSARMFRDWNVGLLRRFERPKF